MPNPFNDPEPYSPNQLTELPSSGDIQTKFNYFIRVIKALLSNVAGVTGARVAGRLIQTAPDALGITEVENLKMVNGSLVLGGDLAPDPSIALHVKTTNKGLLPGPPMTTLQRNAIANPHNNLTIYNTDAGQLEQYRDGTWLVPWFNPQQANVDGGNTFTGTQTFNGVPIFNSSPRYSRSLDLLLEADANNLLLNTEVAHGIFGNAARTITGLSAYAAGTIKTLFNVGAHTITLKHESLDSSELHRFRLPSSSDFALAPGASATLFYSSGFNRWVLMSVAGASLPMVTDYTVPGNYTYAIPAGARVLRMFAIGSGSGGGSGRRGAAGTNRAGGGGGGSAAVSERVFFVSDLGGLTTLNVTVPAGGAGGLAQTVNDTNGNAGGAGGSARVWFGAVDYIVAQGPGAGSGGANGSSSGGSGASGAPYNGNAGGAGNAGSNPQSGATVAVGPSPGGGGGGSGASGDMYAGGGTGRSGVIVGGSNTVGAVGGAINGGNGGQGTGPTVTGVGGVGGAGGGGHAAGAGGNGANGVGPGSGGGGGGGGTNGFTGGAGGNGGPGFVRIIAE